MKLRQAAALALVLVGSLFASACGSVRTDPSAEELSSSKQAYEQCLRADEKAVQCEEAIYDADIAEYEARHEANVRYRSLTFNR
jgi:hypothetical protein